MKSTHTPNWMLDDAFRRRARMLWRSRFFWRVTLFGNICVLGGAALFHWLEREVNPGVGDFIDSLGWAVSLVTTVGSATVVPVTTGGKVLAMFLMTGGAVFLWSYMALFVSALIGPELRAIERELNQIETDLPPQAEVNQASATGKKFGKEIESAPVPAYPRFDSRSVFLRGGTRSVGLLACPLGIGIRPIERRRKPIRFLPPTFRLPQGCRVSATFVDASSV